MNKIKEYALSDSDIKKVLGDDIKIWNYPELNKVKHCSDIFDKKGRCILLYPTTSINSGHWVCLMNYPKKIEYFDSYGDKPECAKGGMESERLKELEINHNDLTRLLRESRKPVFYNTYPFQQSSPNIATCGRHCCVRLLYAPYSLDKYKSVLDKSKMSPDEFVAAVVYNKIKN